MSYGIYTLAGAVKAGGNGGNAACALEGRCTSNVIITSKRRYMNKSRCMIIGLLSLVALTAFLLTGPVSASPRPQAFYNTPTPDAEGRITYRVKAGDTCTSVSLLNMVSIDQLRAFNDLNEECVLSENQTLLIATVAVQATSGPAPTETSALPSPTAFRGNGKVCVILVNDINGNAVAEEGETAIPGGAIDITDRLGRVSLSGQSAASIEEPTCFEDLPEGDYNISMGVPEGYNPTTRMNYALTVKAGDSSTIDFGAQPGSQAAETPVSEGGRSPLLGVVGVFVVLAGIGLGIYARVSSRR